MHHIEYDYRTVVHIYDLGDRMRQEISTESTIIIQARRALANGSDIDLQLPKYLKGIKFVFNDGITAKDADEWFKKYVNQF